jgi:hypothetical protein
MLAVTSFGRVGWEKYARESILTFIEHWPGKIAVCYEQIMPELDGTLLNATSTGKVVWLDLLKDQDLLNVLGWVSRIPTMQGRDEQGGYNFHRDIWKFCRKTFAVKMAMNQSEGPLFWLDADVRLTADIPGDVLREMLHSHPIAYLGRKDTHSECSFLAFDSTQPEVREFINRWAGAYTDGSVLDLPGWHDCWVFDALLKQMGCNANNLSELVCTGGVAERVFEKSILGKYGTHLKGALKARAA